MKLTKIMIFIGCLAWANMALTWQWPNWWATKDQQAQTMMHKHAYQQAQQTFINKPWQAAAAYRAGNYQDAVQLYQSLPGLDAKFNLGNSLAHIGKYQKAVEAYDQVLKQQPHHADAKYNKAIVEKLLKQQKSSQNKEQQEQQGNKKPKDGSSNTAKDKGKQHSSDSQSNQMPEGQQEPPQKERSKSQDKDQAQQDKDLKTPNNPKKNPAKKSQNAQSVKAQQEQEHAKEQWLRLIPEDPGGLLRQKFLRDHKRRQGW